MVFLDGETHICERKSRRAMVALGCIAAIYAVAAYETGSLMQPAVIPLYLFIVLMSGAGRVVGSLLHLLSGG
jgi:hypothetical protein